MSKVQIPSPRASTDESETRTTVEVNVRLARILPAGSIIFSVNDGTAADVSEVVEENGRHYIKFQTDVTAGEYWVFPPSLMCSDSGQRVSSDLFEARPVVVGFFFKKVIVSNGSH